MIQNTVVVVSFGYLHGTAPKADITVDVRESLRDPHVNPAFRELTGLDEVVHERVMNTTGAKGLIHGLNIATQELNKVVDRPLRIAIGCAGGRHRSVVLANELEYLLQTADHPIPVVVVHRHLRLPVVHR